METEERGEPTEHSNQPGMFVLVITVEFEAESDDGAIEDQRMLCDDIRARFEDECNIDSHLSRVVTEEVGDEWIGIPSTTSYDA